MEYRKKLALIVRNHLKSDLKSSIYGKESVECLEIAIDCIHFAYGLNPTESHDVDNRHKMEHRKKLAVFIRNHLKSDLKSNTYGKESVECLEIAIDCINFAYGLNPTESNVDSKSKNTIKNYQGVGHKPINVPVKSQFIITAEYQKQLGNTFLKNCEYEKAIKAYSRSILLNPTNAIYYCKRASGYTEVGKYNEAIEDCEKAIELDPTYSKAYSRQGLAFFHLKDYHKAVSCYKKACELDPQDMNYQRSYEINFQAMFGQPSTRYPSDESVSTTRRNHQGSKCSNFL